LVAPPVDAPKIDEVGAVVVTVGALVVLVAGVADDTAVVPDPPKAKPNGEGFEASAAAAVAGLSLFLSLSAEAIVVALNVPKLKAGFDASPDGLFD
jgi:hypothetical protein